MFFSVTSALLPILSLLLLGLQSHAHRIYPICLTLFKVSYYLTYFSIPDFILANFFSLMFQFVNPFFCYVCSAVKHRYQVFNVRYCIFFPSTIYIRLLYVCVDSNFGVIFSPFLVGQLIFLNFFFFFFRGEVLCGCFWVFLFFERNLI